MDKKMTEAEVRAFKRQFVKLALDGSKENAELIKQYSQKKSVGRQIYQSFSDEELLWILKKKAEMLNHAPSQKEVSDVFREYIKSRFDKWPYALKKAGLSKGAGSGGKTMEKIADETREKEEIFESLRTFTREKGYIPHPHQVPEVSRKLKKYMHSWGEVVEAANLRAVKQQNMKVIEGGEISEESKALLDEIKKEAYLRGRAPMRSEIPREKRTKLLQEFGSWQNALSQIGLEPVRKITPFSNSFIDYRKRDVMGHHRMRIEECYYKVLNLKQEDLEDLQTLKALIKKTNRIPDKREVSEDLRKRLQKSCGTWTNALYQIGIEPSRKEK
ncbi:MAG: hypothetical protein U0M21_00690 [Emergencia sp.]|nr:hypothetical protein [Emergencia sp.]